MKPQTKIPCPLISSLALLVSGFAAGAAAHADSEKFLCAAGFQGGSLDPQFFGCSEVHAYSQSLVSRELDPSSGAPGAKEYQCGDVSIVKRIDAASPTMLVSVLMDTVVPSMLVHFRSREAAPDAPPDAAPHVFLTIELKNVSINSITNSEDSSGVGASALPIDMETLGLAATAVRFTFTPQGATGQPGTPVGAEIDCALRTATPF